MAHADLDLVLARKQHGVAGDFRAGAGRGGDGDAGGRVFRQRLALADDFKIVHEIAAVGEQGGDGFAGVDDAAPAQSHHKVAPLLPRLLGERGNLVGGGLALDAEGGGVGAALF